MNNELMKSTPLVVAESITGSLKASIDNFQFELYNGTPPISADAAIGGGNTQLSILTKNATGNHNCVCDAAAPNGVLSKPTADAWSTLANLASGTATFFRIVQAGDTGAVATTEKRIQGLIGPDGTYAMFLSNPTLVATLPLSLNVGQLITPAN